MEGHIDTHCHLDFSQIDDARADMISRARAVGVTRWIVAGVTPEGWPRQRAHVIRHPGARWTAGLHPVEAAHGGPEALARCMAGLPAAFAGEAPASAVGETGLDTRFAPKATLPQQQAAFKAQLRWAVEASRPVVLHVVGPGAHGLALQILDACGVPAAGGVVHSFSGSLEIARQMIRRGLHIGVAGGVCRPTSKRLHRVVRELPGDRLLVETDAPDQPLPGGPRLNEPACVVQVAEAVARLRGEDAVEVLARSDAAAEALYW